MEKPARAAAALLTATAVGCGPVSEGSDHELYARRLTEIERTLALSSSAIVTLDLPDLSGGDWGTACLFGGYTHPAKVMQDQGASVSLGDDQGSIEEFEAVIAYVDKGNGTHFTHFDHGFGVEGQHFVACVTRPETVIQVRPYLRRQAPA